MSEYKAIGGPSTRTLMRRWVSLASRRDSTVHASTTKIADPHVQVLEVGTQKVCERTQLLVFDFRWVQRFSF